MHVMEIHFNDIMIYAGSIQCHRNVKKIRMNVFLLWLSLLLSVTASTSIGKICSKVNVATCRVAKTKTTWISTWREKYQGRFGRWSSWRPVLIPHTFKMSRDKESIETLEGTCLPPPCLLCQYRETGAKQKEYHAFFQATTLMGRKLFWGIAGQK